MQFTELLFPFLPVYTYLRDRKESSGFRSPLNVWLGLKQRILTGLLRYGKRENKHVYVQPQTQACVSKVAFIQKALPSHLAASLVKSQGERKEDAVP